MSKRAFNPTDSPVVIDDEGHILGGGEWSDVDEASDVVVAAVAAGRLLYPADQIVSEPTPPAGVDVPDVTPHDDTTPTDPPAPAVDEHEE